METTFIAVKERKMMELVGKSRACGYFQLFFCAWWLQGDGVLSGGSTRTGSVHHSSSQRCVRSSHCVAAVYCCFIFFSLALKTEGRIVSQVHFIGQTNHLRIISTQNTIMGYIYLLEIKMAIF